MKQDPFKTNIDGHIEYMLRLSRMYETMGPMALALKTAEETGEFCTAINVYCGHMPHKKPKDTPYEEAADIINSITGVLAKLYPEESVQVIQKNLDIALQKKGEKYVTLINPNE